MQREQMTLLLQMFRKCFTGAKQVWRASDGLLGEYCGIVPLGAPLASLHHG